MTNWKAQAEALAEALGFMVTTFEGIAEEKGYWIVIDEAQAALTTFHKAKEEE